MAHASRASTPVALDDDDLEGRYAELEDWTVGFEVHKSDLDPAPLFVGLPDDRCQAVHLGYVVKGKIVYRFADHDETYEAGDAYVTPPGHVPLVFAGTELVEFSPTKEFAETIAVFEKNLADQGA